MKTYGERKYSSTILDLDTRWEMSASRPAALPLGKEPTRTHCIGDGVGPIIGLDAE
jgi:hypothetical protein